MIDIVKRTTTIPGKRVFPKYLSKYFGIEICEKKASSLMKQLQLVATKQKKDPYKGQASHYHVSISKNNHVSQDFFIGPRKVILTDITYLYFSSFKVVCYLCCFKDAFTSEILGFSVSSSMDVSLVTEAYENMMLNHGNELRNPDVYIHSDSGSQYLSTTFQKILSDNDFVQSTSQRGNSQDNSPMESFFSRLKAEANNIVALAPSLDVVIELITGYIKNYNTSRIQLCLAGLTPSEFYSYVTTGVYPLESYFGVNSSKLLDVNDLLIFRRNAASEAAKKRRESYEEKRDSNNPLLIMNHDKMYVNRLISKFSLLVKKNNEKLDFFKSLLTDINSAIEFYYDSSEDIKIDLKNLLNWTKYPKLNYVMHMGPMF